jgi:hypothetical protein
MAATAALSSSSPTHSTSSVGSGGSSPLPTLPKAQLIHPRQLLEASEVEFTQIRRVNAGLASPIEGATLDPNKVSKYPLVEMPESFEQVAGRIFWAKTWEWGKVAAMGVSAVGTYFSAPLEAYASSFFATYAPEHTTALLRSASAVCALGAITAVYYATKYFHPSGEEVSSASLERDYQNKVAQLQKQWKRLGEMTIVLYISEEQNTSPDFRVTPVATRKNEPNLIAQQVETIWERMVSTPTKPSMIKATIQTQLKLSEIDVSIILTDYVAALTLIRHVARNGQAPGTAQELAMQQFYNDKHFLFTRAQADEAQRFQMQASMETAISRLTVLETQNRGLQERLTALEAAPKPDIEPLKADLAALKKENEGFKKILDKATAEWKGLVNDVVDKCSRLVQAVAKANGDDLPLEQITASASAAAKPMPRLTANGNGSHQLNASY